MGGNPGVQPIVPKLRTNTPKTRTLTVGLRSTAQLLEPVVEPAVKLVAFKRRTWIYLTLGPHRPYSSRSTSIGSRRAARRAGGRQPRSAAVSKTMATIT